MIWQKFENSDQVEFYLEALIHLYGPFMQQFASGMEPFFTDYWLNRFHLCDVYVALSSGKPVAVLSYPKCKDTHGFRWQYCTLVWSQGLEQISLPKSVPIARRFIVPSGYNGVLPKVENQSLHCIQKGFVGQTFGFSSPPDFDFSFRKARQELIPSLIHFWEETYAATAEDSPFLPMFLSELRRLRLSPTSWCYFLAKESDTPVAGVIYEASQVPLFGMPAALVSDIIVAPQLRNQGLGTFLQRKGSEELKSQSINWIFGNIDPNNHSSLRQAQKMGRNLIYETVSVEN